MDIGAHQHLLHVIWKIGVHTTDGLRGGAGAAPMSSDNPKLVTTTVCDYDLQEMSKLLSPRACTMPRRLPFTCWARRQQSYIYPVCAWLHWVNEAITHCAIVVLAFLFFHSFFLSFVLASTLHGLGQLDWFCTEKYWIEVRMGKTKIEMKNVSPQTNAAAIAKAEKCIGKKDN
ncbi:hypothetical protein FA15DRAFT_659048 [Coprinopsis marcescibilis]|uniref:Uncharacterized protein n=1 Tax=Coprinopsis marcescibilis TaxID=230819 RepID=A0A5C3KJZ9_COPMA|nr:hypothetical protein FA15DRAFT_659048 [Coprinopsis marcescibilis]